MSWVKDYNDKRLPCLWGCARIALSKKRGYSYPPERASKEMNCPNCGTYNPEDRETCWRCDKPLPKPQEKKKRDPQKSAQTWLYIAIAVFFLFTILQMCGVTKIGAPSQQQPSGYHLEIPAVAYQIEGWDTPQG